MITNDGSEIKRITGIIFDAKSRIVVFATIYYLIYILAVLVVILFVMTRRC